MRKQVFFPIFLYFLLFVLLFPAHSKQVTLDTLVLWYRFVIPSLLPAMILVQFYFLSGNNQSMPVIPGIFFAICAGFPIGAMIVISWVKRYKLPEKSALFLCAMLNHFSFSFISAYVTSEILKVSMRHFAPEYYLFQLLAFTLIGITGYNGSLRFDFAKSNVSTKEMLLSYESSQSLGNAILKSSEILLKLYGYMLFCNLFLKSLSLFTSCKPLHLGAGLLLEVTSGLHLLIGINSLPLRIILCNAALSLGGLCGLLQVLPLLKEEGFSFMGYIRLKVTATLLTSVFWIIYLGFGG